MRVVSILEALTSESDVGSKPGFLISSPHECGQGAYPPLSCPPSLVTRCSQDQVCRGRCTLRSASCGVRSFLDSFTCSRIHFFPVTSARPWAPETELGLSGWPSVAGSSCCPRADVSELTGKGDSAWSICKPAKGETTCVVEAFRFLGEKLP